MKSHARSRVCPRSALGSARLRRQRGGIGPTALITLVIALLFAMLALDTGRLWLERRNLQKNADMAAMTGVRFTGCGGLLSDVRTAVTQSLRANDFGGVLDAQKGTAQISRGKIAMNAQKASTYTPIAVESDDTNAVRVTLTKTVPTSLVMRALYPNDITLSAMATARGGPPITTMSMGGSMLSFDNVLTRGFNDLLGGILGSNLNLKADALQKLAASSISLKDLMTATGYTTVDDLLNSQMTVKQAMEAYSRAAAAGTADPSALDALGQLVAAAGLRGQNLKLADVLQLNPGDKDSLLEARINLLDLVSTSIKVGGKNGVDLKIDVPGIAGTRLEMGQVPKIAIGPGGRAKNGQWCTATASTNSKLSVNMGVDLLVFKIDMKISVNFGVASAHVEAIDPTPNAAQLKMAVQTSPVTVSITNKAETGPAVVSTLFVPILSIGQSGQSLNVDKQVNVDVPTPTQDKLPVFRTGSGELQGTLAGILSSVNPEIKILWFKDPGLINMALSFVNNLVGNILGFTVDPILRAMGVNIGSADMRVYELKTIPPELVL
jgi:uncharacterized membrane protein